MLTPVPGLLPIGIILGLLLAPAVLSFVALRRALLLTAGHHGVTPALVWLLLVPGLNLAWQFALVNAAAQGLTGRARQLGREAGDGGKALGIAASVVACLVVLGPLELQGRLADILSVTAGLAWAATATAYATVLLRSCQALR